MIAACGNSNPHGGHFDYARRRPCVGNIGRPIVAMTEAPHYPSSAELAAFRRSILGPVLDQWGRDTRPLDALGGRLGYHTGATETERADGIGYIWRGSLMATVSVPLASGGGTIRQRAAAWRTAEYAAAPVESSFTDRR